MLLTITSTTAPAHDLGFVLRKHPDRAQSFTLPFGTAHVWYPEASDERTTMALFVDVDPVALVRRRQLGAALTDHVNDRPYVASSFMSVALGRVLGSALRADAEDEHDARRWRAGRRTRRPAGGLPRTRVGSGAQLRAVRRDDRRDRPVRPARAVRLGVGVPGQGHRRVRPHTRADGRVGQPHDLHRHRMRVRWCADGAAVPGAGARVGAGDRRPLRPGPATGRHATVRRGHPRCRRRGRQARDRDVAGRPGHDL